MFCGVDEAGKGAVLGPLVVAAVACRTSHDLDGIPVKDSKALRPEERSRLSHLITARFPFEVLVIDAPDIDILRRCGSMNLLMARAHAQVIGKLRPHRAYVDACDVIASRYGRTVAACLDFTCQVTAEHHADENRPVVSAASIVAKVTRDRIIDDLASSFGEIGSGYPSDRRTIAFLEQYIRDHGTPPSCARTSWETVRTLVCRAEQSDLSRYFVL
ncbi:MAG: ribonuclease HII [Methanomicrobiales archaeon]|nr:ribonuclease HII [Methanomicrobiales archaeon]